MKEKKDRNYFTYETEKAIIKYNNTQDQELRNKIYREELHRPFFKLTQNIIHTFKYYYTEENNLEDLQHEVITFLLTKLHLFDPSKGAKAYSYFGTVAKRYLIASNQKNYKKKMELTALDALDDNIDDDLDSSLSSSHESIIVDEEERYNHPTDELSNFLDGFVEYCTANIYILFPKEDEAKIADAILNIFRKREKITIFNKKALYIYIREHIDVKTPRITKVANELGKLYLDSYRFYCLNGYAPYES